MSDREGGGGASIVSDMRRFLPAQVPGSIGAQSLDAARAEPHVACAGRDLHAVRILVEQLLTEN
jgi:hypothetical protein